MTEQAGPVDLLWRLDRSSPTPLHEQIERTLRDSIRSGHLLAEARLPSSRGLADELGVSRGVVTSAYQQLVAEGYLQSRQGAPIRVTPGIRPQPARQATPQLIDRFAYDFSPRLPDVAGFPRDRWMRSLRSAWREAPLNAIGYGDPRGTQELREAMSHYLGRVRGAAPDTDHIVICAGFSQGLSLTCRWLVSSGIERIGLEEPGWHGARLVAEQAGLEVAPINVDGDGIDVVELAASGVDVVLVTPAHQFPTGVVMGAERRAALLDWAISGDRLIIEDDYDAELCREPVGALQGLAPDRVHYIGSASKRLAPGLRLGWMLPPSWMSWSLIAAKSIEDAGTEVVGQLALADFIARGELERHIRRMRARYERRARVLLASLARELTGWQPSGPATGLFLPALLPAGADESNVLTRAARAGVGIEGLSLHSYTGDCPPGVVLGFGQLAEPAIVRGVELLGAAV